VVWGGSYTDAGIMQAIYKTLSWGPISGCKTSRIQKCT